MQTPPIPLERISAILNKAHDNPADLTPEEIDEVKAWAGELGSALQAAGAAASAALSDAFSALTDALKPVLEQTASTTCDIVIDVDAYSAPCLLAAGHDGPCDPYYHGARA